MESIGNDVEIIEECMDIIRRRQSNLGMNLKRLRAAHRVVGRLYETGTGEGGHRGTGTGESGSQGTGTAG